MGRAGAKGAPSAIRSSPRCAAGYLLLYLTRECTAALARQANINHCAVWTKGKAVDGDFATSLPFTLLMSCSSALLKEMLNYALL